MSKTQIQRHTRWGIFVHWFNAACWFFLLATGVALISNHGLNPLGAWYPATVRAMFGGGANLLAANWGLGLVWLAVWLVYLVMHMSRFVAPFIKEIFTLDPNRDLEWMVKKNLQMTLGYKMMGRLVKPLGWCDR